MSGLPPGSIFTQPPGTDLSAIDTDLQFINRAINNLAIALNRIAGIGAVTLTAQAEPPTPAAGTAVIYLDVADSHVKVKGDMGTVTNLAAP